MYKIFVEIPSLIHVLVKKLDEMQYKMIKNLTLELHYLFSLNMEYYQKCPNNESCIFQNFSFFRYDVIIILSSPLSIMEYYY